MRSFCSHISVFADAKDQALWWSETFSGRLALGKTIFGLWKMPAASKTTEGDSDVIIKAPPRFMNTVGFFQFGAQQPPKQVQPESEGSFLWSSLPEMDGRKIGTDSGFEWLGRRKLLCVYDRSFISKHTLLLSSVFDQMWMSLTRHGWTKTYTG